jgi:hypothetical protein
MKYNKNFIIFIVIVMIVVIFYFILKNRKNSVEANNTLPFQSKVNIKEENKSKITSELQTYFSQPIKYLDSRINNIVYENVPDITFDIKEPLDNVISTKVFNELDVYLPIYTNGSTLLNITRKSDEEIKEFINEVFKNEKNNLADYFYNQFVYYRNLSELDKLIVHSYKKGPYTLYNRFLRKEKNIVDDKYTVNKNELTLKNIFEHDKTIQDPINPRITMNNLSRLLNNIILDAPALKSPLIVYRTSQDDYYLKRLIKENGDYIYESPSFLSTTIELTPHTALQGQFLNNDTSGYLSIIRLPPGTRGLYMYDNREGEILLPLYSKLKFIGKKVIKPGKDKSEINTLMHYLSYDTVEKIEGQKDIRIFNPLENYLNKDGVIVFMWEYILPFNIQSKQYIELYRY